MTTLQVELAVIFVLLCIIGYSCDMARHKK